MLWILHLGHAWLALGFALHGAAIRVVGSVTVTGLYTPGLLLGGAVWSAGWIVWTATYWRILTSPRLENASSPPLGLLGPS
jgi:uncharacterized protein involved in response to NO